MGVTHTSGNSRTASRRGDDLYETPAEATLALLKAEALPQTIWEPACGRGAIARVLRAAGHQVWATDLVDYRSPDQDTAGVDFLMERQLATHEAIVTNPPFKLAGAFVSHALDLCPKVIMLARLNLIESASRSAILDDGRLARVLVFKNRLPMMHRDGWDGPKVGSSMCFAWFVWDRSHVGPTTLHRISWEELQ